MVANDDDDDDDDANDVDADAYADDDDSAAIGRSDGMYFPTFVALCLVLVAIGFAFVLFCCV